MNLRWTNPALARDEIKESHPAIAAIEAAAKGAEAPARRGRK